MNASSIRIPLPSMLETSYGVFVKLPGAADNLEKLGLEWASRLCQDPARTVLTRFIESDLLSVRAAPRKDAPMPPIELLRAMGMGPEEERRYREATHVVLVIARSPFRDATANVFAALAMAKGLAAGLDGVVFDPQGPRLLPVPSLDEPLTADGRVAVANFIVCPMSSSKGGAAWMTTKGMGHFGLPNFEMRNVPPNLQEVLAIVMSVAERVLCDALDQAHQAGDTDATEVVLPAEISITQEDMVAAFGKGSASAGQTTVRLSFDGKGREGLEPFVEIGPPASYTGEPSEWCYAMLTEFIGKPESAAPATQARAGALGTSPEDAAQAQSGDPFARFLSWSRRRRWILTGLIAALALLRVALRSSAPESAPAQSSHEGFASGDYLQIAGIFTFTVIIWILVRRSVKKNQLQ